MKFNQGWKVKTVVPKTKLHLVDSDGVKKFKPRSLQVLKGSQGTIIASEDINGNIYVEFKSALLILHKDCLSLLKNQINLKIRTNQLSGEPLKALFKLGCTWSNGSQALGDYTYHEYLMVKEGIITTGDKFFLGHFFSSSLTEVTPDELYEMAEHTPYEFILEK